ncbi:cytochrome P450 [Allomeiothermus silvanus DSM 9946]|uniref:Cytochrome P450 n=1 Tax=Allomeiothermus silvanus (strain ATCC 700542 / DSM 9946 / NBRC 106475 / NCIMB 13440 / VI-R2) TaxID=526227 RepID=D7BG32_ALLS1|nr:cytochrome P450 [Allomeiothermus silvanus]ADH61953.1 cytochrome P450 [Allomeiothermus silvanus DSM 9946]
MAFDPNDLELRKDPLRFFIELSRNSPSITTFRFASGQEIVFLNHPDLIREVLIERADKFHKSEMTRAFAGGMGHGILVSEGEFWKQQSRLIRPAFHYKRLLGYAEVMSRFTLEMLEEWQDGEVRRIDEDMNALTLRVVAKCMFNVEAKDDREIMHQAIVLGQQVVGRMIHGWFTDPHWTPSLNRAGVRVVRALNDMVQRHIAFRRERGDLGDDLLSMLMEAQQQPGVQMSERQLRDEVLTIITAGLETTANALIWTWYLLDQHPEVKAKLQAEVDALGELPNFENLHRLPYLDQVFKEALRLYPPVWVIGRETVEELELGGMKLPPKTQIVLCQWATHRDPRFFEHPDEFIPERWTAEFEKQLPRGAYFPFSLGPRVCTGQSFATTEFKIIVATTLQRFDLELAQSPQIKPEPNFTLWVGGGLKMRVRARGRS